MKSLRVALVALCVVLGLCVSAAVAAGGHGESESPWTLWMQFWRIVNTIALIALLIYALKKPVATFFSERKEQIQKDLQDAKEALEKAEALIREYEHKMAGMSRELDTMRAELAKASEAESQKVIEAANLMSAKMVETARVSAEQEVRKAKIALRNEAVDLAVQLAEALISEKIDDADRQRIAEDFLAKVGGMK